MRNIVLLFNQADRFSAWIDSNPDLGKIKLQCSFIKSSFPQGCCDLPSLMEKMVELTLGGPLQTFIGFPVGQPKTAPDNGGGKSMTLRMACLIEPDDHALGQMIFVRTETADA